MKAYMVRVTPTQQPVLLCEDVAYAHGLLSFSVGESALRCQDGGELIDGRHGCCLVWLLWGAGNVQDPFLNPGQPLICVAPVSPLPACPCGNIEEAQGSDTLFKTLGLSPSHLSA